MPADLPQPWPRDANEDAAVGPVDPGTLTPYNFEAGAGSGDTRPLAVVLKKGTGTNTSGSVTTTAAAILAANPARIKAEIQNAGTVPFTIGTGIGVTAASGLVLYPGGSYTDRDTVGAWYAITASGTGNVRIVETA